MKLNNKLKFQIIKQYMIGWTIGFILLSVIRGEGTEELGSVDLILWKSIVVSLIWGITFGSLSGYAQILTETYGYKKMSIQKLLVLRLLYIILFITLIVFVAYLVFGENISFLAFAFEPGSLAIFLCIITIDIFMFLFRQVSLFLGSDNLWKLFTGKFYEPREEHRIFMFLDLKSSTTHAEKLGHIKYSKLIQDCFNDLGVVSKYEAEIYQYVGDEVILTWELNNGIKNQNCIKAFYKFKQQLENKKQYYLETYNCIPKFKAGVNSGTITVTEVGKYKKEIAYHGDTINIAARIQGKCNEFEKELLISKNLKIQLNTSDFKFEELGVIELRGKENKVSLFSVITTKKEND